MEKCKTENWQVEMKRPRWEESWRSSAKRDGSRLPKCGVVGEVLYVRQSWLTLYTDGVLLGLDLSV